MRPRRAGHRGGWLAALVMLLLAWPLGTRAQSDDAKHACVAAHSQGQDLQAEGRVTRARALFLTCAQESCPALVRADCARFADELGRTRSTLTFIARSADGRDLPNTSVYVDDVLVWMRLDAGDAYEIDPGPHVIRFQHGAQEQVLTVVVGMGERARGVVATFPSEPGAVARQPAAPPASAAASEPRRPLAPKLAIAASAAALGGGVVLGLLGLSKIPEQCSRSSRECMAPPQSAVYDDASSSLRLSRIGWGLAAVGAAGLGASIVWYVRGGTKRETQVAPAVSASQAALQLTTRF